MTEANNMQQEELARALADMPADVTLKSGESVQLRLMTRADREAVLAFAQALPLDDLLFLRVDITEPKAVDEWIGRIESGHATTVVACKDDQIVGYATVDRNPARWTRRVGEIRVNVGPDFRSAGLGAQLTAKIFSIAFGMGLKKLMAQMTPDQLGAQAAFKRLGFVPEAVLADFVEDRNGMARDLLILAYDVDGLTDQANRPLRV